MNSDTIILKEISKKLDWLIALYSIQGKDPDTQVRILRSLNFTFAEVSKLTGIPDGTLKSRNSRKSSPKKKG